MSRDRLLTAGLLLTLLACGGDPSGPPPPDGSPVATSLAVGDTVVRALGSADTLVLYTIRTDEPAEVALFIQAENGVASIITDSVTHEILTFDFIDPDPAPAVMRSLIGSAGISWPACTAQSRSPQGLR